MVVEHNRGIGSDGRPKREVHLAGPPELTTTCVLPSLAGLVGDGLRLRVTLGRPAEQLLAGLEAGTFDIVVSTIEPIGGTVVASRLLEEEFVLVAAAGTPVDRERLRRDPSALDGLPLIAYAEDLPIIRRYWRVVFGVPPPRGPAVVVPDLRGVLAVTTAGGGVTVLPRYLCARPLASGRLIVLLEPASPPTNTVYLASAQRGEEAEVQAVSRCLLDRAAGWQAP
jgi:DNA-binding transcriptional LysR family regulator